MEMEFGLQSKEVQIVMADKLDKLWLINTTQNVDSIHPSNMTLIRHKVEVSCFDLDICIGISQQNRVTKIKVVHIKWRIGRVLADFPGTGD